MQSVQERITKLEGLFTQLFKNIRAVLNTRSVSFQCLKVSMTQCHDDKAFDSFFPQRESVEEFLTFIEHNWSWLNHELLEKVVNVHCSDELEEEMTEYVDEVNKFRHGVTVEEMMEYFNRLPKLMCPPEFSFLRVKMDYGPQSCFLAQVYNICLQICILTELPVGPEFLTVKKCEMEANSLYAVFFMPKVLKQLLLNAIQKLDNNVWRKQHVLKLIVDDTVVCPWLTSLNLKCSATGNRVNVPKDRLFKMSTLEGDFHNLLALLAEELSTEDNLKLEAAFGDGVDETGYEILMSLEKRDHFSVDNIQPLEDLLTNLCRDDLIVKYLLPFKHKYKRDDLMEATTMQLEDGQPTLDLSNRCVSEDGFDSFDKYPSHYEVINLSGNQIVDEGVEKLSWFICKCTRLQVLNLCDNQIGDKGVENLSWSIRDCTCLHTLNLSGNHIGDDGLESLSWGLRVCSSIQTLTTLNLSGNQIGDRGAWRLALDLQEFDNLQTLNLKGNQIGDEGALYWEVS